MNRPPMLTRMLNIVTGTYARWNATNNATFTKLWDRVSGLDPAMAPIFREILLAAYTCLSSLIGPDRSVDLSHSRSDIWRLGSEHYGKAYATLIAYYGALLPPRFREPADEFERSVVHLVGASGPHATYRTLVAGSAEGGFARVAGVAAASLSRDLAPLGLHDGINRIAFDYAFAALSASLCQSAIKSLEGAKA